MNAQLATLCVLWTVYRSQGVTNNTTVSYHQINTTDSGTTIIKTFTPPKSGTVILSRSAKPTLNLTTSTTTRPYMSNGNRTKTVKHDYHTTVAYQNHFTTSKKDAATADGDLVQISFGPSVSSFSSNKRQDVSSTPAPSTAPSIPIRTAPGTAPSTAPTTAPRTAPCTAPSVDILLSTPDISNAIKQVFQQFNVSGSDIHALMNTNKIGALLGTIFPDSQVNSLLQELVKIGRLGDLFSNNTENINMQKLLQSPLLQTVIHQALENKTYTSLMKSFISDILLNEAIDQNMTDIVQAIYGNTSGPVVMLLEVIPLIGHVRQLMNPETLSSIDQCTADMAAYLQGLFSSRMWALQMLDASGKPGKSILKGSRYFLGNYDECSEIDESVINGNHQHKIRGRYWTLKFSLPTNITRFISTNLNLPLPDKGQNIGWDLCLPASCQESAVTDAINKLPLDWLNSELIKAKPVSMNDWKDDASAVVAVVIMALITALTALGTTYDVISGWLSQRTSCTEDGESVADGHINKSFVSDDGKQIRHVSVAISMVAMNDTRVYPPEEPDSDDDFEEQEDEHQRQQRSSSQDVERRMKPIQSTEDSKNSFVRQLLLSFSVSKNTEKLLNTETGENNLGCIHGIRVLSMAWVILGHSLWWSQSLKYENPVDYFNIVNTFTMQGILGATLAVDTFFVLSGCLVCYLFLKETKKSRSGKPTLKQMGLYYVHRYWRLTPVYMIIIMLYTCLLPYLVDGPLSQIQTPSHHDTCRENWWINLLYINNLYKTSEMCFGWSWFLANDMQFYVIAPLALLPIAFGLHAIGILVMVLLFAVHIISYGYIEHLLGGSSVIINAKTDYMSRIYLVPWCRVGPFAIGLILGYTLYKTKCKVKIPRYGLVLGWQMALLIGLLCTYITYDAWKDGVPDWPARSTIAYETLYRPGWAIFVSWIILVCCTGHGGVVNSMLSWGAWQPLGRLTYGAYLIHPVLLTYTEYSVRSLVYFNVVDTSYHFIGTFAISYALSFIACILVEAPCMGLEKALLSKFKLKR